MIYAARDDPIIQDSIQEPSMSSKYGIQRTVHFVISARSRKGVKECSNQLDEENGPHLKLIVGDPGSSPGRAFAFQVLTC